jgi:dTMP kinase
MLADALRNIGIDPLVTREPGGCPSSDKIRKLILEGGDDELLPDTEILLFAAARNEHVHRVILPALKAGRVVLCDRYVDSTLAYQGAGRGCSMDFILQIHRHTTAKYGRNGRRDPWMPDVVVFLDIDPAIGVERSKQRLAAQGSRESHFENLDPGFHERVSAFFREQAGRHARWAAVDALGPASEIHVRVIQAVNDKIGHRLPRHLSAAEEWADCPAP